jgi:hypothetical protein
MRAFIVVSFLCIITAFAAYPVPTPAGGRFDVHGWLILPIDADSTREKSLQVDAWFSHHVPELFIDSPHNFQIILRGTLLPQPSVGNHVYPLSLPIPPIDDVLTYEYSFTPPSPFSLNDLLNGDIQKMNGVFYNGSFDTLYERIPMSLASLVVTDLTTAIYLNESESDGFPELRYLSYPRGNLSSEHFYFAHEIHQQPDFDHVVHGVISNCSDNEMFLLLAHQPGISWVFPGMPNDLAHKLYPNQIVGGMLIMNSLFRCDIRIVESIHCMIGPAFMENC